MYEISTKYFDEIDCGGPTSMRPAAIRHSNTESKCSTKLKIRSNGKIFKFDVRHAKHHQKLRKKKELTVYNKNSSLWCDV